MEDREADVNHYRPPEAGIEGMVVWSEFYKRFVRYLGGGPSAAETYAIEFVS